MVGATCIVALVSGVAGCAPSQRVPLIVEPGSAAIYVDGELLAGATPDVLELQANRPHVLFFKHEGYRSEQVVLRSEKTAEGHRLTPGEVSVRLQPLRSQGRSLRVEIDDPGERPVGPAEQRMERTR